MKLFDSELKVLDILWDNGDTTAKKLSEILREQVDWRKTTTYTVIKKCVDKGVVGRQEPNFVCHALISREQAQEMQTTELINKMYGGMPDQLIASILWRKDLSQEEIKKLKNIIKNLS